MKTPASPLVRNRLALAAALALACGCDANHVLGVADGGAGSAGATSTGEAGTLGTGAIGATGGVGGSASTATGAAGAKADPATLGPAESWTGYIENRMFASGSDMLTLKFATDANGVVTGTIIFGMGTPPPPATDPNVGYPPDFISSSLLPAGFGQASRYIAEGFPYAFDGGTLGTNRLRFTANLAQLWAGWCTLQTPASDGSGGCLPNWASMSSGDGKMCALLNPQTKKYDPVDCGKFFLCEGAGSSPCSCTATACGLSNTSNNAATFDIFLTGDTASGSVEMTFFGTNNVHFVKN